MLSGTASIDNKLPKTYRSVHYSTKTKWKALVHCIQKTQATVGLKVQVSKDNKCNTRQDNDRDKKVSTNGDPQNLGLQMEARDVQEKRINFHLRCCLVTKWAAMELAASLEDQCNLLT